MSTHFSVKNASRLKREAFRYGGSLPGDKAHGAAFFAALYDAQLLLALIFRRRRGERELLILRGNALPHAFKIIKFHRLHLCIICALLKKCQRCEIIKNTFLRGVYHAEIFCAWDKSARRQGDHPRPRRRAYKGASPAAG